MWYPNFQRERNTASILSFEQLQSWGTSTLCRTRHTSTSHCGKAKELPRTPRILAWFREARGFPARGAGAGWTQRRFHTLQSPQVPPHAHTPSLSPAPCPGPAGALGPRSARACLEGTARGAPCRAGSTAAAASPCCSRDSSSCWRSWRGARWWGSARGASARPSPGAGSVPAAAAAPWRQDRLRRGGRADPRPCPPLPQPAADETGRPIRRERGGDKTPRRALHPAFQPQALWIVVK